MRRLLRQPVIFDGRNLYEPERMAALGFTYHGIGRAHGGQASAERTERDMWTTACSSSMAQRPETDEESRQG